MATISAEAKPNVLIVDDDVVLCEMLAAHLKSEYRVQCAHTCSEALTRMNARQADVVILDYDLPDGPGLSVVHKLRSCNPHLRVMLISGDPVRAKGDPNFQSAAVKVALSKPFTGERLRHAVENLLAASV